MLEIVFNIFVICLSIIGLIEIFRVISICFFSRKKIKETTLLLIPVYGHKEGVEMVLRNAITNAKWLSGSQNIQIICLNLGMDDETRKICEIFSEEFEFVEIYSLEEFAKAMEQSAVVTR